MNIVTGTRKITHDILSVFLIMQGEDFIHPGFGMKPEIFETLSDYPVEYWVYNATQEVSKWVRGISSLSIDIVDYTDAGNSVNAQVKFVPVSAPNDHILTFGWFEYQGVKANNDITSFRKSVSLDNEPFYLSGTL